MSELKGIISEIDIIYKKKIKSKDLPKIDCSATTNEILRNVWSDKIELYEEFVLLVLNRANKCLGWVKISQGGISGTVVDSKIILAIALKAAASGIIVAHNHPSGGTIPSQADKSCTRRLKECCSLFDITFLDHMILSGDTNDYYSFADNGEL